MGSEKEIHGKYCRPVATAAEAKQRSTPSNPRKRKTLPGVHVLTGNTKKHVYTPEHHRQHTLHGATPHIVSLMAIGSFIFELY